MKSDALKARIGGESAEERMSQRPMESAARCASVTYTWVGPRRLGAALSHQ